MKSALANAAASMAIPVAIFGAVSWAAWHAASAIPSACIRPSEFGALADDGQDDRDALQAAIDAAVAGPGCLDLGPGRYDVTRRPEPGAAAVPSLVVRASLRMRGPATLAMLGSAVRPGETAPGDWVLVQVQASDVHLSDLAFEGGARTVTGEQTHLLQIRGPSERVTIERSTFDLPIYLGPGPEAGWPTDRGLVWYGTALAPAGDCIRLLGEAGARIRDVTIRDVRAPACYRSFLGVQRGVHGLVVERVETIQVRGQAIDFEPTGGPMFGCTPIVSGVVIRDSVLRRGTDRGITLAIAGDGCALADDLTVLDTAIEDGGVDLVDVGRVELAGLRIESARSPVDAAPALYAHRRVGALLVRDSRIVRLAGAKLHPVVQISRGEQPDQRPVAAVFHRVTIEQPGPRAAIRVEGLRSLVVRDALLLYRGEPPGDWAVSGAADSTTLVDVTAAGSWRGVAAAAVTLIRTEVVP